VTTHKNSFEFLMLSLLCTSSETELFPQSAVIDWGSPFCFFLAKQKEETRKEEINPKHKKSP
ncbi:MAG: hypothetical protein ABIN36_13880, partial [Ferruginibacter sp.]